MIPVERPDRIPMPRVLVLAWMASLSFAAGYSARCYVDELLMLLGRPFEGGD
jgi:hypothetical protein